MNILVFFFQNEEIFVQLDELDELNFKARLDFLTLCFVTSDATPADLLVWQSSIFNLLTFSSIGGWGSNTCYTQCHFQMDSSEIQYVV